MVSLRRVAMAASSTTNVHQPLRSGFSGKFLVPETLQDQFDPQKLARASFSPAVEFFSASWHPPRFEANASQKPRPYIVFSVLTL
jgi:hypothetical protein